MTMGTGPGHKPATTPWQHRVLVGTGMTPSVVSKCKFELGANILSSTAWKGTRKPLSYLFVPLPFSLKSCVSPALPYTQVPFVLKMVQVEIERPAWLRNKGFYFRSTRLYTMGGVVYQYKLYNARWGALKCNMSGQRGMLRYQFLASVHPQGLSKKLYSHRLWALNFPAINSGPRPHAFSSNIVAHYHPQPHWRPWSNRRTVNMVLMTRLQHKDWHRANPGVPRAPGWVLNG